MEKDAIPPGASNNNSNTSSSSSSSGSDTLDAPPPPQQQADKKAAAKAARKAAAKQQKADRRARREGGGGGAGSDPLYGAKPCSACGRARHLLVRCRTDASGEWQMLCGDCWTEASGGVVDGAPGKQHYRYGGLWKNHHALITGRNRAPKQQRAAGAGAGAAAAAAERDDAHTEGGSDLLAVLKAEAAACREEQANPPPLVNE